MTRTVGFAVGNFPVTCSYSGSPIPCGTGTRTDPGSSFDPPVDKLPPAYGRCASRTAGRLDLAPPAVFSHRQDKKRRYTPCGYKPDNLQGPSICARLISLSQYAPFTRRIIRRRRGCGWRDQSGNRSPTGSVLISLRNNKTDAVPSLPVQARNRVFPADRGRSPGDRPFGIDVNTNIVLTRQQGEWISDAGKALPLPGHTGRGYNARM